MPNRLVCCGLLLLSPLALGDDALDQASRLSREMKFPQALEIAKKIIRAPDAEPEQLARAYAIEGTCLAAQGKESRAVESFRRALSIQPDFRLPDDVSPKIGAPFEEALKTSKAKKPITLRHEPPSKVESLAGLVLKVRLDSDPSHLVSGIRVRLTPEGGVEQVLSTPVKTLGPVTIKLPSSLKARSARYRIEATNRYGATLARLGSEAEPLVLGASAAAVAAAPSAAGEGTGGLELDVPGDPGAGKGTGASTASSSEGKTSAAALETPPPEVGAGPDVTPARNDGEEQRDERREAVTPWYRTWWFWTGVGILAAGAVAGGVVAATQGGADGGIRYQVVLK
ncbi:MAG: hypothetical protein GYA21_07860 [Myxococcales bacterium]|nr:hypothetical protein [Myxococcales bacterium]